METQRVREAVLPALWPLAIAQGAVAAASLVVEIVAGRVLAPYVGMSLYTWTSVIAVVLAGFSAGHWLGGRIAERPPARALALTGWAMVGAALTSGAANPLLRQVAEPVLGTVQSPLAAIVALAVAAFFLPSFFAGVPAPPLARIAVTGAPAEREGRALGAMFAAGAIGAIVGTLLAGFLFISWIGSSGTLAVVTAAYALLAVAAFRAARRAGSDTDPGPGGLAGPLVALLAVVPAGVGVIQLDPCTRESDYFCIRVLDLSASADSPVRLMVLDHLAHGVSARDHPEVMFTPHSAMMDVLGRARMAERPGSFRAFFIGGGSYSLPRAWSGLDPAPDMTVAEVDPRVTEVAQTDFWFDPATADVVTGDARRALARSEGGYDLIVGDAFTDIAVPQHLITEEFFRLVAARLAPGGTYLMNVIDHADRLQALAAILRTLSVVFPVVEVWAEPSASPADARLVFIVVAGDRPTPQASYAALAPDPMAFGRLSPRWMAELLSEHEPLVLTDDFAPIDRLMRWSD